MFLYFGAKARLAPSYQKPKHDLIVEPFAGSAGYSMYWLQRRSDTQCLLIDSDPLVVEMWDTLLNMTPEELWHYPPPPEVGTRTHDPIYLACFVSSGSWGRRSRGADYVITPKMSEYFQHRSQEMAQTLSAVKGRVEVQRGDYSIAPNITATWFIDPPYQTEGIYYTHNNRQIDYSDLSSWCQKRRGQVIVCESSQATWLPFQPHRSNKTLTGGYTSTEAVWYSHPEPTLLDLVQQDESVATTN